MSRRPSTMPAPIVLDQARARHIPGWLPAVALGTLVAVLYVPVGRELIGLWQSVSYYSYGVLVPLWSAWLVVTTRGQVTGIPARREPAGLVVAAIGLATLAIGSAHGSVTLAVLSLPIVLTGLGRFWLGPAFRPLAFPVGFLALMTPVPPALLAALSLHLQGLAAWWTAAALPAVGIRAARHGLFVELPSATLHIGEACNGLRFLLAMVVLGVAFAWAIGRGPWARAAVLATAVVAAIAANLARVAGTGVIVELWGPGAAVGASHELFGKAVYLVALAAFIAVVLTLRPRRLL